VAPYARTEIVAIAIVGGLLTVAATWFAQWWAIVPAAVALALLAFYRDPQRTPPAGDNLLLAPADGRVIRVERTAGSGASGGTGELRVVIFLSVFDVHVNRSPCAGRVREVQYRSGRFLSALKREATDANEYNLLTLDPAPPLPGPVYVRQIAGVLARRVVCAVRAGEELAAGQRIGMIKLGSQTEVRAPDDPRWIVNVGVGDNVKGGLTVLARYEPDPPAHG